MMIVSVVSTQYRRVKDGQNCYFSIAIALCNSVAMLTRDKKVISFPQN